MNSPESEIAEGEMHNKESPLLVACREGRLEQDLNAYLARCRGSDEEESVKKGKDNGLFPNVAGFCRYMKTGTGELESIRADFPKDWERLLTVLEDEALNSNLSPTLLSAYLKKRMGYDKEKEKEKKTTGEEHQLKICFEHDIFEDGG